MKGTNARRLFALLLAGAFVLGGGTSWARPPRACQANGVVRSIDQQGQTICLLPVKGAPLVLGWKRETWFWRNAEADSAAALKAGTPATVHYRLPLLGKPFASKISWTDSSCSRR